jgi:hypothetical protein
MKGKQAKLKARMPPVARAWRRGAVRREGVALSRCPQATARRASHIVAQAPVAEISGLHLRHPCVYFLRRFQISRVNDNGLPPYRRRGAGG